MPAEETPNVPQTCCPICGHEFDEVKEEGNTHRYGPAGIFTHGPFTKDELIGTQDDYAWCQ